MKHHMWALRGPDDTLLPRHYSGGIFAYETRQEARDAVKRIGKHVRVCKIRVTWWAA